MNKSYGLALLLSASSLLALMTTGTAHAQYTPGFAQCRSAGLTRFNGTIAEAAAATPELSTLYALVNLAGLADALNGPGPLTVYAPVNSAFDRVPAPLVDLLTSDPQGLLTQVLTYHVSLGVQDPRTPFLPNEIKTLQGQTVFLEYENGVGPQVNQSNAKCKGVKTSNGVVWLIDSVLLPQFTAVQPITEPVPPVRPIVYR